MSTKKKKVAAPDAAAAAESNPSELVIPEIITVIKSGADKVADDLATVERIVANHNRLKQTAAEVLEVAVGIGRDLCALRAGINRGSWGWWFKQHIESRGISQPTAYRYMALYKRLGKPASLEAAKAEIQKLELPGASVTGVYRGLGILPEPAKSSSGGNKPGHTEEPPVELPAEDRRLKLDDVREARKFFASLNERLPTQEEIESCKDLLMVEAWLEMTLNFGGFVNVLENQQGRLAVEADKKARKERRAKKKPAPVPAAKSLRESVRALHDFNDELAAEAEAENATAATKEVRQ